MKTRFYLLAAVLAAAVSFISLQAAPAAQTPTFLRLTLPEIIYAAPGIETNIYFENVIDSANPAVYAYEVRCKVGAQKQYRWHWTPAENDAGKSFDLTLTLFNDYGVVISGKSKVVVAAKAPDMKKKITLALLGDSGVNCQYPQFLLKLMREKGFSGYTPVGSHGGNGKRPVPGGIAHDGYGGYAWWTFLNRWVFSNEELKGVQDKAELAQMKALGVKDIPQTNVYRHRSPLLAYKNGKKVLDIPGWFQRINNGKAPDFIIIELGGNDVFGCRPEKLDDRIKNVMGNASTLLNALRKHAPKAVIGVTTAPCGCGQDGFGVNYGCSQSKYQFRRNIQRYNREIVQLVKDRKDPDIRIIPLHQSVDPMNSYIYAWPKVHARSKTKLRIDNNALHASTDGGAQMADAIYCWLRKQLEK